MSGTKTTWAKVEKGAVVVDTRAGKLKPITKTKTFLQIGNAVHPLLAEAVIAAAIERPSHAE